MNNTTYNTAKIIEKLETNISIKQNLQIIEKIYQEGREGKETLLNILIQRRIIQKKTILPLDGLIFETLFNTKNNYITKKLNQYFPNGIMIFKDTLKIDYQPLQELLIQKKFKEADQLTQKYLCQLAGLDNYSKRQWLYFTDIPLIPSEDLYNIDLLWRLYSQSKFGFSIQRKIWKIHHCNWNQLWEKIGWTNEGVPCRYPEEFTWTIDAPAGHLPLFNQLRGMQVLSSLFEHIIWQQITEI